MKQQYIYLSLLLLVLLIAGYFVSKTNIVLKQPKVLQAEISRINKQPNPLSAEIYKSDISPWGNPQAPIKIVEYGDYLCIYCAYAARDFYPKIENLINEGKVVFYFKDLISHRESVSIANAARCANEQNKFWEFNKAIFQLVLDLSEGKAVDDPSKKETWLSLGKILDLELAQFEKCIDEGRYMTNVQKDVQEAIKLGFSGTPSFIINGEKISGLDLNKLNETLNKFLSQK